MAYVHVTEFQKRGLPHEHFLLIMASNSKLINPDGYDRVISAEIPDHDKYPVLHGLVVKHMLHGPCGNLRIFICQAYSVISIRIITFMLPLLLFYLIYTMQSVAIVVFYILYLCYVFVYFLRIMDPNCRRNPLWCWIYCSDAECEIIAGHGWQLLMRKTDQVLYFCVWCL